MQNIFIDNLFFTSISRYVTLYLLAVKKLYFKNPRVLIFFFKALCKRTQHCWMLHVVSVCTPRCVLFVAQSLKPVKLLSQQLPTSLTFVSWSPKHEHNNVRSVCAPLPALLGQCTCIITHGVHQDRIILWVVSFPRCSAGLYIQQCWELLRLFARSLFSFL